MKRSVYFFVVNFFKFWISLATLIYLHVMTLPKKISIWIIFFSFLQIVRFIKWNCDKNNFFYVAQKNKLRQFGELNKKNAKENS